jgi:signal transduction histidine kinase
MAGRAAACQSGCLAVLKSTHRSRDPNDRRDAILQIDEFLAMLSHELRQPLAAALAAIEIQKKSPRADSQEKARRVIEQQVRYIARLVGDLSEVSHLSHATLDLKRERVDVRDVLRDALTMSEALFDEGRHQVWVALGDDPLWVDGDGIRLKQVFSNLFKNAAAYTPPEGRIHVRADLDGGHVCVRVGDNGAGIPPDALERIFELFQRGPHRADGQSAGVGLAVVKRIVGLHGGSVSAASDGPGRGAEFTVLLPVSATIG